MEDRVTIRDILMDFLVVLRMQPSVCSSKAAPKEQQQQKLYKKD
jgi:hypothetical protein